MRSVHSPPCTKNRKCPVADVGTSAVNSHMQQRGCHGAAVDKSEELVAGNGALSPNLRADRDVVGNGDLTGPIRAAIGDHDHLVGHPRLGRERLERLPNQ